MSVIRQRRKNMIVSGLVGFLLAVIVLILMYLFWIRGNEVIMNVILRDSNYKVTAIKSVPEEVVKKKVYTLTNGLAQGEIITGDKILALELEERLVPESAVVNKEDLLNKKAKIDLGSMIVICNSMIEEEMVYTVDREIVEIHDVRIPEILSVGDRVNVRIHYPAGQDYTVVEDKEILHIDPEESSFFITLSAEEILNYSSAKEDENLYAGANLYLTQLSQEKEDMTQNKHELNVVLGKDSYSIYPLNPNAQNLSLVHQYNQDLLEARMLLDASLLEFFDQEGFLYHYEIAEEPEDVVIRDGEQMEGESGEEELEENKEQGSIDALNTGESLVVNNSESIVDTVNEVSEPTLIEEEAVNMESSTSGETEVLTDTEQADFDF